MRQLKLSHPISITKIKLGMSKANNISDYKRWQVLYFVSEYDVDATFISDVTGYSKASIYSIVQTFNKSKGKAISVKQRGGRRREIMSVEEEQEMMKSFEDKAMKGQIVSALDIKRIIEQKVKKSISDDYVWDLFKRNGWSKHSPRPHHPNKDIEKQNEFKKNSKTIWMPPKMILTMS